MSKETNNAQDFDRVFQQKLAGHSVAPPAGMWDKINANTAASKRSRGLIWIITNDSSIMLLILLLTFFSFGSEDSDTHRTNSDYATTSGMVSSEELPSSAPVKQETSSTVKSEKPTSSYDDSEKPVHEPKGGEVAYGKDNERPEVVDDHDTISEIVDMSYAGSGEIASKIIDAENPARITESSEDRPVSTEKPREPNNGATKNSSLNSPASKGKHVGQTPTISKKSIGAPKSILDEALKIRQIELIRPLLTHQLTEDSLKNIEVPTLPGKDLVGKSEHEIYIGAHANFNLPLIFNQNTYGAFSGKELAYKPTFGMASGARIGYTFKRQYGFQTGFIFYSRQGQDYEDNLNGFAAKRQVKLQYFHVPIILRYKFKIKKQQKFESPWVINLGADVGILRSAAITYDGNAYSLDSISNPEANDMGYFKPTDISVVLGVEKEIYFTKWLMMSVGIRTTFSGDINADGHPVENDGKNYEKSHNFTFGFTLGLNYYMRR